MADLSCIHMLAGDSWYMGAFKYLHWYDLLFNFFIGLVYSDALCGIYIGLVIDGSGVETDS